MKILSCFFWNRDYPARSFIRIFVVLSVAVYLWGRMADPGPAWAQAIIAYLIRTWNLEFIQSVGLLGKDSPTLWRGSGFALQIQLLVTWPVMWVFALSAGWMCRNGSKSFIEGVTINPIPQHPTMKDWFINFGFTAFLLCINYFPFQGSDGSRNYKPTGIANVIFFDSPTTCAFWIMAGCFVIYCFAIMFYAIKIEYHLTFNKGDRHD